MHDILEHKYGIAETGKKIPSLATIMNWSRDEHWQEQITQLDGEIEKQVKGELAGQLAQNKIEHLKAAHSILRTAYDVGPNGEIVPGFKVNSSRSFKEMTDALSKLEGEEPSRSTTGVKIAFEMVDGRSGQRGAVAVIQEEEHKEEASE